MFMDVEASHKGRWTFTQDLAFDINNPASYPSTFSGNIGTGVAYPVAWNPSFYVQDTWQVTSNLTFNLGLRYDLDNSTTTVNEFVDDYNARIVATAWRRAAAAEVGRRQEQLRAAARSGVGARPPIGR